MSDETYVVTLTSAGLSRNSRALSLAFNPLQRYLAAGTCDGRVIIWRFTGDCHAQRRIEFFQSMGRTI